MDQSRNATLPHSIRADGCEAAVGAGDANLHGNGLTSGPERIGFAGVGRVAVGSAHQGFDLQLTRYDERGWRATFHTTGMEHSPTSATGTGWERTPWHATQRAAWEVLRQQEIDG